MRALEVLAFGPLTAPKVADHLGVHPRTARRLLSQLQRDGWLSYSRGVPPMYAPTLRLVALAAHVGARSPLATMTAPALQRLHTESRLPAVLSIASYDATVCLARCVADGVSDAPPGVIEPAHGSAAGRVLLASRPEWRGSVLGRLKDRDVVELERELARISAEGYAVATEAVTSHVAAPVGLPDTEPVAAIGIVGVDVDDPRLASLTDKVCTAAASASAALAAAAGRAPLHRTTVHRQLASYGLAEVDAYV